MRRPYLPLALILASSLSACIHAPSSSETLPKLRAAIASEVSTPEQNAANSALAEQVSQDKQLQGLTRDEVAEKLGKGDSCSHHPICSERGFDSQDWYYEIGQEGSEYVRHRPSLLVGFSRFGKVERTFVLRAPD